MSDLAKPLKNIIIHLKLDGECDAAEAIQAALNKLSEQQRLIDAMSLQMQSIKRICETHPHDEALQAIGRVVDADLLASLAEHDSALREDAYISGYFDGAVQYSEQEPEPNALVWHADESHEKYENRLRQSVQGGEG